MSRSVSAMFSDAVRIGRAFASAMMLGTVVALALGAPAPAVAQEGPGGLLNPQRDCQTILQCNFKRGGLYRGCISAYSCRYCRFVPARCSVGERRRNCRQVRCTWG